MSRRRRAETVDKAAAAYILQGALERLRRLGDIVLGLLEIRRLSATVRRQVLDLPHRRGLIGRKLRNDLTGVILLRSGGDLLGLVLDVAVRIQILLRRRAILDDGIRPTTTLAAHSTRLADMIPSGDAPFCVIR